MRGRGIDFEHRFRTSRWAEDIVINGLGRPHGLLTVRFGLSEIRPEEELEYDTSGRKEPDLLVYDLSRLSREEAELLAGRDLAQEPRSAFTDMGALRFALHKALAAFEVEFSPYKAAEMKGRHWRPRGPEEWARRPLKHATPPTAPNVFVKEEDLGRLIAWERTFRVPIIVTHLFDQEAFAVRLSGIEAFNQQYEERPSERVMLQVTTGIFKTVQVYERVDAQGAAERKPVFRVTPCAAVKMGDVRDVRAEAQLGVSASKKYVSQVLFTGGRLEISPEFLRFLRSQPS